MKQHCILFLVGHRSTEKKLLPGLQRQYDVVTMQTRRDGMRVLANGPIDLVLLDVLSLRFDVQRFCDDMQRSATCSGIFLLLGKGTRLDQMPRAQGYLRHPFSARQLLSRLARVLPERRGEIADWHGLRLDIERHLLLWDMQQVPLTPKQAALARAFLRVPGEVISRVQLMQEVWGTDYMGDTRTLDVHIHWLRKSLVQIDAPFVLETERGQGYRLVSREDEP